MYCMPVYCAPGRLCVQRERKRERKVTGLTLKVNEEIAGY